MLAALFLALGMPGLAQVAGAFYGAGALVLGGGHVVLPLLQHAAVDPGWLDENTFLAGSSAAQAISGAMFSLAAFFGQHLHGALGATVSCWRFSCRVSCWRRVFCRSEEHWALGTVSLARWPASMPP